MIALLCVVFLSLSSCLWIVSGKNTVVVDGVEVDISAMFVASLGIFDIDEDDNFIYGVQLFLAGDGVEYDPATGALSGSAPGGMIVLLSYQNYLTAGTAVLPQDGDDPLPWLLAAYLTADDVDWSAIGTEGSEPDTFVNAMIEEAGHTGNLVISEPRVGDWLLEWDVTGINEEDESASSTGTFQGNITGFINPVDVFSEDPAAEEL
jgi:hypothetical protein